MKTFSASLFPFFFFLLFSFSRFSSHRGPRNSERTGTAKDQRLRDEREREREEARRRKEEKERRRADALRQLERWHDQDNLLKRPTDFICKMKFFNTLPDPPCDSKLLDIAVPLEQFGEFRATSLQRDHRHDIVLSNDLGLGIDIVDPRYYTLPVKPGPLDPEDEALLRAEKEAMKQGPGKKKKTPLAVPWLRKSEFITAVFDENLYNQSQQQEEEEDVEYVPPERDAAAKVDRNLRHVAESFNVCVRGGTPVHPFDPKIKPVSVKPLVPNRTYMGNQLYHVLTETAPAPLEDAEFERSNAIFVGHQLPEDPSIPVMVRVVPRKRNGERVFYFHVFLLLCPSHSVSSQSG